MARTKYGNKRVKYQGISFDSIRERNQYILLKDREKKGEITNLELQVNIALVVGGVSILTPTGRQMHYRADFVFRENGKSVVMDAKGFATDVYKMKKAIMLAMKIEIIEV